MKGRQKYSLEYKQQLVAELNAGEHSLEATSRETGINPSILRRWKQEAARQGAAAFPGSGRLPAPEAELARLRREVDRLSEENEILKKAQAYFQLERPPQ